MDWIGIVEDNKLALQRLLAMMIAMAGLSAGSPFFSREAALAGGEAAEQPRLRLILPRRLRAAVLRLLRPAEFAMRRLVAIAARGLPNPELKPPRKPKAIPLVAVLTEHGMKYIPEVTAVAAAVARKAAQSAARRMARAARLPAYSLPLFDPLRRRKHGRRRARRTAGGWLLPLSADDPVSATRVALRLAALGRVLDDLPAQARRFARWRARRAAADAAINAYGEAYMLGERPEPPATGRLRSVPFMPCRSPRRRQPPNPATDILLDLDGFVAPERPVDTS